MTKRDNSVRIRHMLDAAEKVVEFTQSITRDGLDADEMRQLVLIRLITIIGEASKQTTAEFREQYDEIEWKSIAGMKNRLIHGYDTINLDILWKACVEDVPRLITQLEAVLREETGE